MEQCVVTAQELDQIHIRVNLNPVPPDLAVRHLGIIARHVYQWYRYIPLNVRAYYGADDMIADVTLHVHSQMLRYQPEKARQSTWVYQVALNACRDIVQRYQRRMRNAVTVELDEATTHSLAQESFLRKHEAISAVERVIAFGSEAVQDLIECLLSGDFRREADLPKHAAAAIEELRDVARSQNATAEDFLLVYRHATA